MKGIFRMKPKVYYNFKESIKNREVYLSRMRDYFWYREMYISSKKNFSKENHLLAYLYGFLIYLLILGGI